MGERKRCKHSWKMSSYEFRRTFWRCLKCGMLTMAGNIKWELWDNE